jgi:hypothetical protein
MPPAGEGRQDMNYMGEYGNIMNEAGKSVKSKAEFLRLAGIGPELAEFVTEFVGQPEAFRSISLERRRTIENQMDVILSLFGKS